MALPTVSTIDWDQFIISLGDTTAFITKFEAYLAARNLTNGEQDVLLQAMVDWANTPEDTLIPAVSGGNQVDDYSFVHWFAKTVAEKNAAAGQVVLAQDEVSNAAAQVVLAQNEVSNAAAQVVLAQDEVTNAAAWATTPEDTPVPVAAGGNGTTDFSAMHWAAKAGLENGIDDGTTSLTTTYSSTKIEQKIADAKGATGAEAANIILNSFNIAVNGGLTVQAMVDGVSDIFTDQSGIDTARSVAAYYRSQAYKNTDVAAAYPPAHSTSYVKATTENKPASEATNPASSKTGARSATEWRTTNSTTANQRFHIDLGAASRVLGVNYNNSHDSGALTDEGARAFTLWGSNDAAAFAELTYGTDTNWTQLTTSITEFARHADSDIDDDQTFDVDSTAAYRYYAFKIATNWGDADYMGLRHVELLADTLVNTALHTVDVTALAEPDEAYIVIHQQDIDPATINTDLTAWVSRTAVATYTTNAATDNKLHITGHGFSNDDRVILSTPTGDNFPTGLDGTTAYYVINAAADDFEVSLTSGGAAVAITADNGGTQNVTDYCQAVLSEEAALATGRILTGTADLTTQASGTDIHTVLLMDSTNIMKIHALSTQWS